jgi:hypothetical protein
MKQITSLSAWKKSLLTAATMLGLSVGGVAMAQSASTGGSSSGGASATAKDPKNDKNSLQNRTITGRATRVAILNFGPPLEWNKSVDDMVGVTISHKAFKDQIKILKDEKVDVVVVHINSGGGYGLEVDAFHKVFEEDFEPNFRTVAWVHYAGSAAQMAPWVLDEIYMEPEGAIGGSTGWVGNLQLATDIRDLIDMEAASRKGGHNPMIGKSMQLDFPLSANVDDFGNVELFQDATSGRIVVNPPGQVLMLNAVVAQQIKLSRGIADTVPELMKAMKIEEYEIVADRATRNIQNFMRQAHRIEKSIGEVAVQYGIAFNAAQQLRGADNREARNVEIGRARRALNQLRQQVRVNPNFEFHLGRIVGVRLTPEWFEEQERVLRELSRDGDR